MNSVSRWQGASLGAYHLVPSYYRPSDLRRSSVRDFNFRLSIHQHSHDHSPTRSARDNSRSGSPAARPSVRGYTERGLQFSRLVMLSLKPRESTSRPCCRQNLRMHVGHSLQYVSNSGAPENERVAAPAKANKGTIDARK